MIDRRQLFGAAAGSLALMNGVAAASTVRKSKAAVAPRGVDGRLVRLATLELEAQQDFTRGMRTLHGKALRAASLAAFDRVLEREGIDPATPITVDQLRR
ncbi:MAG: hypothetical protein ACKO3O_09660, partial [Gammaproteobacteria bacterium]